MLMLQFNTIVLDLVHFGCTTCTYRSYILFINVNLVLSLKLKTKKKTFKHNAILLE